MARSPIAALLGGACILLILVLASVHRDPHAEALRYALAHERAPLFAFPGTDIEALRNAAEALELSASIALPAYPADMRERLYPTDFLSRIPAAERARRLLHEEPTAARAEEYHNALLSLIEAHQEALSFADAVLSQGPQHDTFENMAGSISIAEVRAVLARAMEEDARAHTLETERFDCLRDERIFCPAAWARRTDRLPPDTGAALDGEASEHLAILSTAYPELLSGEVVTLPTSACVSQKPAPFLLTTYPSRLSGVPAARLTYLGDLYLNDTSMTTHPYYAALAAQGARFVYQPLNAYLCPDLGADLSAALTLSYLRHGATQEERALLTLSRSAYFERVVGYFDDLQVGSAVLEAYQPLSAPSFLMTRGGLAELYGLANRTIFSGAPLVTRRRDSSAPYTGIDGALRSWRNDLSASISHEALVEHLHAYRRADARAFGPSVSALISAREALRQGSPAQAR